MQHLKTKFCGVLFRVSYYMWGVQIVVARMFRHFSIEHDTTNMEMVLLEPAQTCIFSSLPFRTTLWTNAWTKQIHVAPGVYKSKVLSVKLGD